MSCDTTTSSSIGLRQGLITITKQETSRLQRRNLPTDGLDEIELVDDHPLPEDEVMSWERAALVRIAVERLTDTCRELVSALFFDQRSLSYTELAERLRMPIGSIGPTRARCFRRLAIELANVSKIDPEIAVHE